MLREDKSRLSIERRMEQSKNKTALTSVFIMNALLVVTYFVEVLKGSRSVGAYAVITALCILPLALAMAAYFRRKDTVLVRYICTVGFGLLYAMIMFTTDTDMPFSYVLVYFSMLVVYADFKLSVSLWAYMLFWLMPSGRP